MKKHFPILRPLLIFIIIIINVQLSCRNEKEHDKDEQQVKEKKHSNIDHLKMFFGQLNPKDQRAVFNGLPSELKYALVDNHWKQQLDKADNDEQKNFIRGLIDHLKPAYYKDTALYLKEAADFFRSQWNAGLQVYKNDSAKVASILFKIDGDPKAAVLMVPDGWPGCECNIKYNWCFFGNCDTFDCNASTAGCAAGLLERCDGMCY